MKILIFIFLLFNIFQVNANSGDIILVDENEIEEIELNSSGSVEKVKTLKHGQETGMEDNKSGTGNIEPLKHGQDTGEKDIKNEIDDFNFVFQNPSYILDRDKVQEKYICDEEKDECKINFKLEKFDGKKISSKLECEIDFGFEKVQSCNPKTVIFPEGKHEVKFLVYKKGNRDNFIEKILIISNKGIENVETSIYRVGEDDSNTGSGKIETLNTEPVTGMEDSESGSGELYIENNTGTILKIPKPIIDIQSGLEYSGSGNIYSCNKEDCKVNLTAVNSFSGIYEEKNYVCEWNFGGGSFKTSNTDKKCNPGYVEYGSGNFEIGLKIIDKKDENNFSTASIFVKNIPPSQPSPLQEEGEKTLSPEGGELERGENGSGSSSGNNKKQKIYSGVRKGNLDIIVQSGLKVKDNKNYCENERCKVNLKYDNASKETCVWDFGTGEYKQKYLTTCNPGFIYFGDGVHKISLKVYKVGVLFNSKELTLENNYFKTAKENNRPPVAKITLQGKVAKYKTFVGNKIICNNVDKCSINLTGTDSSDPDKDNPDFYRDFGNGETSDRINPHSIKYKPGKYTITLKVSDRFGLNDTDTFFVEVISKSGVSFDFKYDKNLFNSLKIEEVLPNPKGKDNLEWIKLKNTGDTSINLKGLIIDDIVGKGSKGYIVKKDIYLKSQKSIIFIKSQTKISLGNTKDEVNIVYNDKVLDSLKWDFSVPSNYILSHSFLKVSRTKVIVDRVVDGDTIVIKFPNGKKEKLRFIGVDTPETKHPKKEVEFFGKEASDFTKKMLEGKTITVELNIDNYRDKYGRLLGYVYVETSIYRVLNIKNLANSDKTKLVNFNKLLIELGYARAYLRYPFKFSSEFEKVGKKAKKDKIGIWSNKEFVKLINKETKEDKLFLENNLKKDLEKSDNNIVFSFEYEKEILNKKIQEYKENKLRKIQKNAKDFNKFQTKLLTWDFKKIKNKSYAKNQKNVETSIYRVYKNKINFSQSIYYQKKALKIAGKTLSGSKVLINIGDQNFETMSDESGKYSFKLVDLKEGNFEVISKVYDINGKEFNISRVKKLELTKDYLVSIKKKNKTPNPESVALKKKKKMKFSQSIAYQKKSLKIYGYTVSNSKVIIYLGNTKYETQSDSKGKYALKLTDLKQGDYIVKSSVLLLNGKEVKVSRTKKVSLSEEYLEKMVSYEINKQIEKNNVETSIYRVLNNKSNLIIPKANASDINEKSKGNFNLFLISIFLGIISILYLFLIVRKHKII